MSVTCREEKSNVFTKRLTKCFCEEREKWTGICKRHRSGGQITEDCYELAGFKKWNKRKFEISEKMGLD